MRRLLARLHVWYRAHVIHIWIGALLTILLALYLLPAIVITVPPGHAAVLWRRFDFFGVVDDGTVTAWSYPEGTHYKLPWDRAFLYDTRLRDLTSTFGVLMNNGLRIQAEVTIRFRPLEAELGNLHKYVGPEFTERLVVPELLAHARNQMSKLTPDELYSSRRQEAEDAIYRNLVEEFEVRFTANLALFGVASHLRREVVWLLNGSETPLSMTDLAGRLSVEPASLIEEDVRALVRAGVLRQVSVGGQPAFTVDPERAANSQHANDLLGQGRPLIYVEDVLIRNLELPQAITDAIQRKLAVQQETEEYEFRVQREVKESERKRIEAEGIRRFQDIVSEGISDRYLKWKGIDATLSLAQSPNSKIVVIGSAGDGLPLILGPLETTPQGPLPRRPTPPAAAPTPAPAPAPAGGAAVPPESAPRPGGQP